MESDLEQRIALEASRVFTPASPIDSQALFAGRRDQLRRVVDAVAQKGQHAIVFGERGVGKTSLARVLQKLMADASALTVHVNCDASDDFSGLWLKVFAAVKLHQEVRSVGFQAPVRIETISAATDLPETLSTNLIWRLLALLAANTEVVIILDELDRLRDSRSRTMLADTIKALSDQIQPVTLVLVGVADDVDELIAEHESVSRALVQVQMPRMSRVELEEIIDRGMARLSLEVDAPARERIISLSRGLPHYTHALCLHGIRSAVDAGSRSINVDHVDAAVRKALDEAAHSTRSAFVKATSSARRDSHYFPVLLACALARTDSLGFFTPADVRAPLQEVLRKPTSIANFLKHLEAFVAEDRRVLQRVGGARRYRYRYRDPLMQPYVIMQGLAQGLISGSSLVRFMT